MATLKLTALSGEIPRINPMLLPDTAAQHAENVRLEDGSLNPVRQAALAFTFPGTFTGPIQTIYKHGADWLAWESVVNAAPGPVAADRLYYTGDGIPKMRVNGAVYNLAVPFPSVALTVSSTGTPTGPVTERLYVYTFVTAFGEESEPCPISAPFAWQAGMNVTLSGFQAAPAGRNITKQRIYRSQDSAAGTNLFFIFERDVSAVSFPDTAAPDAFGELIPSLDWNAPPATLTGLISIANGMLVGFAGKEICFSEPFVPHAWPEKYRLTVDYDMVALGAYGTTIVAMTTGQPYIAQGSAPESMQIEKVEQNYPCINARGVVDLGYGIAYPTWDGLVVASSNRFEVVTGPLLTRIDWLALSPSTFVAGQYNGRYFATYTNATPGLPVVQGTVIIDLSGATPFLIRASRHAEAMYFDLKAGALYMLNGVAVYEWDAPGGAPEPMRWMSKRFSLAAPATYGCILAEGEAPTQDELAQQALVTQAILDHNAAVYALGDLRGSMDGLEVNLWPLNGDALGNAIAPTTTTINIYADNVLAATVNTLNEVLRLPPIPRARNWEVEVLGTNQVTQISLATSPRELNTF